MGSVEVANSATEDMTGSARGDDRVEQAREARVHVLAAELVQSLAAVLALHDHAGLPQDAEVVGRSRLGNGEVEGPARAPLLRNSQRANDLQPDRVTQGVE